MGKDSTKNLVGQPIFKQIIKMIPKDKFDELVFPPKALREMHYVIATINFSSCYTLYCLYIFDLLLCRSKKKEISFEEFYAFDSSTIALFSEIMKGAGRNPRGDVKKKGGLKVHMLTDVHADRAVFATVSEAKMHDRKFLSHLNPAKGSMLVFDRAYNYYQQFSGRMEEGVN
jgi:hypothetical protein